MQSVRLTLVLLLCAPNAFAGDLLVYVFRGDAPVEGIEVALDATSRELTDGSGQARFGDLAAGTHRVALRRAGQVLHSLRFDSAGRQNADVVIQLPQGDGSPDATIETYDPQARHSARDDAPSGRLTGTVTAGDSDRPIASARVTVRDAGLSAASDENGRFALDLPRGVYTLEVSHPEHGQRTLRGVRVVANVAHAVDVPLQQGPSAQPVEVVVAVGRAIRDRAAQRKHSSQSVLEVIDAEQLTRFADSDAAEAVARTVGVTIQDDKFVFVRGLGGRYTTTTLNGASLASTDPTRRVVPLDLFPADMLESISVQKTFSPELPGDSTGGNVRLETKTYPAEPVRKVSVSISAQTQATGSSLPTDPTRRTLDFTGVDREARELPGIVRGFQAFENPDNNLPPLPDRVVEVAGESFNNELDADFENLPPDFGLGVSLGDSFALGGSELGYLAVVDYSNSWSVQQDGLSQTFRREADGLVRNSTSEFTKSKNSIDLNGLLSLGASVGLDHQFKTVSMITRNTFSSVRVDEGRNEGTDLRFQETQIEWTERMLFTQSVSGEHLFSDVADLELDWRYAFAHADRFSPDRRSVLFQEQTEGRGLQLEPERGNTERRFEELEDDNHEFNTNITLPIELGEELFAEISTGGGIIRRERDFEIDRFGFRLSGDDRSILFLDSAEQILSPQNIGPRFTLEDRSVPRDDFDAEWDIDSWYIKGTLETPLFQLTGGLRVEDSRQTLDTFSETTGRPETVDLEQRDTMPSVSASWFMTDRMQLRLAYSETVARPDFKELSNARFVDPVFDFVVQGNSDLVISDIESFDVRWEWFFDGQDHITIGAFYKEIDRPIERVFRNISSSAEPDRFFRNQESAELLGVEANLHKEFALDESYSQSLFLAINASVIDSDVDLDAQTAVSEGQESRRLQDQAKNTLNVHLGYDHLGLGHQVTVLYNRVGDRISEGGGGGLPEVIEEPRHSIDLVYEYTGWENLSLKANVQNLLNESVEFTQGGETFREFDPGIGVNFSASWRF